MGPTWVLSAPVGPHVVPMNLAIRDELLFVMLMQCELIVCIFFQNHRPWSKLLIVSWLNIDTDDVDVYIQLGSTPRTRALVHFIHYLFKELCNKDARASNDFDNGLTWNKKGLKWSDDLQKLRYELDIYHKGTVNGSPKTVGFTRVCL